MLPQFTDVASRTTLKAFIFFIDVYAIGRLAHESKGLLLLINVSNLLAQLTQLGKRIGKVYFVQVKDVLKDRVLILLCYGGTLKDGSTMPAIVAWVDQQ